MRSRNHIVMSDYISLSTLNDFIFCPYSIYLHNVYMDADEDMYKATPQITGTIAHNSIDSKKASTRKADIMSLPVYSETLGISGRIDLYKADKYQLIERKNNLKKIFRGQIYQLWGQYFCMTEMGYEVRELAFYEISTNKMIPISLPDEEDRKELETFIRNFIAFDPYFQDFTVNKNKCIHCIYCNLCDKTNIDNVYE